MISAALVLLEAVLATSGPVYRGIDRNLRVEIPRIEVAIAIDGELSEPVWEQAARLTGFSQYAPDDGRAATDETEVLVWYSPSAIHVFARMADPARFARPWLIATASTTTTGSRSTSVPSMTGGRRASSV